MGVEDKRDSADRPSTPLSQHSLCISLACSLDSQLPFPPFKRSDTQTTYTRKQYFL
ncbi:uncharacterized protein SCHCODRAFT_02607773 [Schizophyllum commune H4-8]|uniref:uncharacterized protein n=1 Tax=Schizophyllum commune (strain H4-8 / FGSC 9210) TaxID=578458 RepID=UPI00215E76B8|nr:uncharacterized protein SCHCODRAFT_02607773 [Schizophyllum commune H4-8]KAI5900387.1 hypothetical protein SCHCODRAFT_02607773 [Schizophyllum commune H4-8]